MHKTYLIFCADELLVRHESSNRFALKNLGGVCVQSNHKAAFYGCHHLANGVKGIYSNSILTLLGKSFNMAYNVLMLN